MSGLLDPDWIRGLTSGEFFLYALLAWGACVAAFYIGWRFQRRLRLIEDTPQSMIRSAAQGCEGHPATDDLAVVLEHDYQRQLLHRGEVHPLVERAGR